MTFPQTIVIAATLGLAGCAPNMDFGAEPTTRSYTEPRASGLTAVRPYPEDDDVCQQIKENDAIRAPVDDGTTLIACPKHERGALMDRKTEGADVLGHARHWTVLVAPAPL